MTRELIINGQAVDLLPDTDITLEYVSDIFGEPGKISLPRSYTIRIPRTAQNAYILDCPGQPGHDSAATRRYLSARFYRNGIDLLGEANAYILRTTPEEYEIALVWNTFEALQALSQSEDTLNNLRNLPVLPWLGQDGKIPDYAQALQDGAFFAFYNSGLGGCTYPDVNAATHPCMTLTALILAIMENAGVPYSLSDAAARAISGKVILAAPKHSPNQSMEIESGCIAGAASIRAYKVNGVAKSILRLTEWVHGWDSPSSAEASAENNVFTTGENDSHRVLLNFLAPLSADLSGRPVLIHGLMNDGQIVTASEEIARAYFKRGDSGWYLYFYDDIQLSGWPRYSVSLEYEGADSFALSPYDESLPMFSAHRVHDVIDIANDNRFPLQGNLPDIKQWDFIKACMVQFGLVPIIRDRSINFYTYAEVFATHEAYDWSSKVDMINKAPEELKYTLDSWARQNIIAFQEDQVLSFDPNARIVVEDTTIPEMHNRYELPWAASMQSAALHYRVKDDDTLEEVDIAPRIFEAEAGENRLILYFSDSMYGSGLIEVHYKALQDMVRRPVLITAHIRLHEIDLARLDLTRPVYLGQYGHYYAILKIQTSNTDLCKVELLQLP